MNIGIVVADFNSEITLEMLQFAEDEANQLELNVSKIFHVPGVYDVPLGVRRMLDDPAINGVVVLGAVITGETGHDVVITEATAKTLQTISVKTNVPITLGVIGPAVTREQVVARKEKYARNAVKAVLQMLNL
ncbi:MAG: 6,7-dimethyl-8-ribityllumazine synthase [Nanoarchaeota archaeon]|nr:6,7-dimethyl-8-ribityllumazine synthase [Nanoarchaeota archaeon]